MERMMSVAKEMSTQSATPTNIKSMNSVKLGGTTQSVYLQNSVRSRQRFIGNSALQAMTQRERGIEHIPSSSQKDTSAEFASDSSRSTGAGKVQTAISASGAGTVSVKYSPNAGDKSTKIVFIQVMQNILDGTPVKPSEVHAPFAYRDADTTSDFYHVDYLSGESDPYYNGDDAQDGGTQGNATASPKVDATMTDTPNYPDAAFPAGKTQLTWEFRTIAFSAAGADKGTYYEYARWSYNKEKGKAATIGHHGTSTNTALPKSKVAINLWASNHGFAMPK